MDHLWLDSEAQWPPEKVPIIGYVIHGGDFLSFPGRCGYDVSTLQRNAVGFSREKWAQPDDKELHALSVIQEWLFFGIIAEVTQIVSVTAHREELIKYDGSHQLASTRKLPDLLEQGLLKIIAAALTWNNHAAVEKLASIRETDINTQSHFESTLGSLTLFQRIILYRRVYPAESHRIGSRLQDLSYTSRTFLTSFIGVARIFHSTDNVVSPRFNSIWMSCFLLAESIAALAGLFFNVPGQLIRPDHIAFWIRGPRFNGACPLKLLRDKGSITGVYLAGSTITKQGDDHKGCKFVDEPELAKCEVTRKVDGLPQHSFDCAGDCEMVGLDTVGSARTREILSRRSYPVVRILKDPPTVEIEDAQELVKKDGYIAISHVWSHGLGNPNDNALPICQLRKLSHFLEGCESRHQCLTEDSSATPYFWLDTLCVPLTQPYRRHAIARMRQTYASASRVLVLDRDTLSFAGHNSLRFQRLAQSDWLTRLWTYQEAVLASNLFIVFADGAIRLADLTKFSWSCALRDMLVLLDDRWSQTLLLNVTDQSRVLAVAESLHKRTTSKPSDEFLCLTTLLDIDLGILPSQPCMVDVLRQLDELPDGLLFTPGPRSTVKRFRWSPATFLDQPRQTYGLRQQRGRLTAEGFCVRKWVIFLKEVLTVSVEPETTDKYFLENEYFVLVGDHGEALYALGGILAKNTGKRRGERLRFENPALVVSNNPMDATGAVVVLSNLKKEKGTLYGHYETCLEGIQYQEFRRDVRQDVTTMLKATTPEEIDVCVD